MNNNVPPVPQSGPKVPPVPSARPVPPVSEQPHVVPGEMTMPLGSRQSAPPVPQVPAGLPEVQYVISHVRGFFLNSSGGRLHITADGFYFRPHAVNFNTITYRWTYDQIAGYSKGFLTYMKIHLVDGRTETIQTYKKNAIINTLEKYRHAWFAARGLQAPSVKR
ncbi:MAG: hypothetical protein K2G21_02260 [Muribaculaceae bacterium]|nr:hypothetical protein [Muribaculaceae bacterium]